MSVRTDELTLEEVVQPDRSAPAANTRSLRVVSAFFELYLNDMAGRLTHRDMLSYGFKQGEPWAEDSRHLERALIHPGISGRMSRRSISSALPAGSAHSALQRQYSSSAIPGSSPIALARTFAHALPGSQHIPRASHTPHNSPLMLPGDPPGTPQYRASPAQLRPVSPHPASPASPHMRRTTSRSYGYPHSPASSYGQARSPSPYITAHEHGHRRHSSRSRSSPLSAGWSRYDGHYAHAHNAAPYASNGGVMHHAGRDSEASFVVEPSDSGSEASYSQWDSESFYSGSEGDSFYSDDDLDEYDDSLSDDSDGYSGYYSDD